MLRIPFQRGVHLAQQYNVDQFLAPLFDYKPNDQQDVPMNKEKVAPRKNSVSTVQRKSSVTKSNSAESAASKRVRVTSPKSLDADSRSTVKIKATTKKSINHPTTTNHGLETTAGLPEQVASAATALIAPAAESSKMQHRSLLLAMFVSDDRPPVLPEMLLPNSTLPPDFDIDMELDDDANAAIHYAACFAQTKLTRLIIQKGASPTLQNKQGETALMRAVKKHFNFDHQTFPYMLKMLKEAIPVTDSKRCTIFHHIAAVAGSKGRAQACNYYMECLIQFITRYCADPASPEVVDDAVDSLVSKRHEAPNPKISLASLVNCVDCQGNTAMNIAAVVGSRYMVQQLLDAGADPTIPNNSGLCPTDFGFSIDPQTRTVYIGQKSDFEQTQGNGDPISNPLNSSQRTVVVYPSVRTDEEVSNSQVADFASENVASEKPSQSQSAELNEIRAQLREVTRELAETRYHNTYLRDQLSKLPELNLRIKNLESSLKDAVQYQLECGAMSPPMSNSASEFKNSVTNDADAKSEQEVYDSSSKPAENIIKDLKKQLAQKDQMNERLLSELVEIRGLTGQHELQCKRIIAACCNIPIEDVEVLLEPLLEAVESDDVDLDMNLVSGFMSRVQHQDGSRIEN